MRCPGRNILRPPPAIHDGAHRSIPHTGGLGENLPHPRVRRERFPSLDADGGPEAERRRIDLIGWFLLYHFVKGLPKRVIRRANGIKTFVGNVDEPGSWGIAGLRQGVDLGEFLYHLAESGSGIKLCLSGTDDVFSFFASAI